VYAIPTTSIPVMKLFIATTSWSAFSWNPSNANYKPQSQMAALQAKPLTAFISCAIGCVFPAGQFLLKCLEVDELKPIGLRHPDWVALRVFVEQTECSC
jgi:hypothetical protein